MRGNELPVAAAWHVESSGRLQQPPHALERRARPLGSAPRRNLMNAPHRIAYTLPLLLGLLAGCARQGSLTSPGNSALGASADQAEVASAVAAQPTYVDDEVSERSEERRVGKERSDSGVVV